jgi:hypothetical protein
LQRVPSIQSTRLQETGVGEGTLERGFSFVTEQNGRHDGNRHQNSRKNGFSQCHLGRQEYLQQNKSVREKLKKQLKKESKKERTCPSTSDDMII